MSEGQKQKWKFKWNTVEKILDFDNQNQEGQVLEMLTSNQMFSRLPIFLAQLKAGNNSEKLKNEIWQLLYYLYRSNKLTKLTNLLTIGQFCLKMWTNFMNTKNSKTNESKKFFLWIHWQA